MLYQSFRCLLTTSQAYLMYVSGRTLSALSIAKMTHAVVIVWNAPHPVPHKTIPKQSTAMDGLKKVTKTTAPIQTRAPIVVFLGPIRSAKKPDSVNPISCPTMVAFDRPDCHAAVMA